MGLQWGLVTSIGDSNNVNLLKITFRSQVIAIGDNHNLIKALVVWFCLSVVGWGQECWFLQIIPQLFSFQIYPLNKHVPARSNFVLCISVYNNGCHHPSSTSISPTMSSSLLNEFINSFEREKKSRVFVQAIQASWITMLWQGGIKLHSFSGEVR